MTVKEATRHLLKQLETIGWTVSRGRYPMARLGDRVLRFRPRSIDVEPGGPSPDRRLSSAKHYAYHLDALLLDSWEGYRPRIAPRPLG